MRQDNFVRFVEDIKLHMPTDAKEAGSYPSDAELRDMGTALSLFRVKMYDSCSSMLSKYNYSLTHMVDAVTGDTYDLIKEKYPIRRGWGTFIYNRNHKKRVFIHVNHPIDDPGADAVGAELFRTLSAEWLLIAGTPKYPNATNVPADIGRAKKTVFQRWHELLTDLTHITLSVHAFKADHYVSPINTTDVVISNGKTTDEQWGISELSLAYRDSLRTAGFNSSLAMYDSGYAPLSGGWNIQGTFSNDSVGFGHWLYIELSEKVRNNPSVTNEFIAATNRALDLTGKKISQQMNRAWGLVSPRVVRVDSAHRIMFPPSIAETYRIISFNAGSRRNDTLDIRMGNWVELMGSSKTVTRVTRLDSTQSSFADQFGGTRRNSAGKTLSQIVKESPNEIPRKLKPPKEAVSDSSMADDDDRTSREPLQVHRIPLRPVLASTLSNEYVADIVPFRWEGLIEGRFTPHIVSFNMNNSSSSDNEPFSSILIPIINSSYSSGRSRFIGIQMTQVLIDEIARLVYQHNVEQKDVGLIAEEVKNGDYYLRIFPSSSKLQIAGLIP